MGVSNNLRQKIHRVLNQYKLSSRDLSAFADDVCYYLDQLGLFVRIRTKKTSDPECALLVNCVMANPATSPAEVGEALLHIWAAAPLGYDEDAYELEEASDRVQLHFMTLSSDGVVVTGRIEVTGFAA